MRPLEDKVPPDDGTQLHALLTALCEGQILPEQLARLDQLVCQSERVRRLYIEYMDIHAGLHRTFAEAEEEGTEDFKIDEKDSSRRPSPILGFLGNSLQSVGQFCTSPAGLSILLATATLSCLLLTLAVIYPSHERVARRPAQVLAQHVPIVAKFTRASNVEWADASNAPAVGANLRLGQELKLDRGVVAIIFKSGARVHLQGPAAFRLQSTGSGFLKGGRLAALVPSRASGFFINTDVVTIVDLGTEFAVEAKASGTTDVACLQGKIQLDMGRDRPKRMLSAGASARISPQGKIEQAPKLDLARFPRELPIIPRREVVNIDFNQGNRIATYQGSAAFSSGGNYWNGIAGDEGFRNGPLLTASRGPTDVTIQLYECGGVYTMFNNTGHALEDDYAVVRDATGRFVLRGLSPGQHYDLYLYGTAGKASGPQTKIGESAEGSLFTIAGETKSTAGLRLSDTEFTAAKDYVLFRRVRADVKGEIQGVWAANPLANAPVNTNPFGPFNGLQIVGKFSDRKGA